MNNLPDESSTLLGLVIIVYLIWAVLTLCGWVNKDITWRYEGNIKHGKLRFVGTWKNRLRIICLVPLFCTVAWIVFAALYVLSIELYDFITIGTRGLYEYYIK